MIEVRDLQKKYGRLTALQNVSCSFAPGQIYGVIGYNGAGKTSFLKTLAGIYRPDAGSVRADGRDVFDDPGYKSRCFTLGEDLFFRPQADLRQMRRFTMGYYPGWDDGVYTALLQKFALPEKKKLAGFSKGMQRQAGILLGLATRPAYLFLDESFDGLDWEKRDLMVAILRRYAQVQKATIVVTSHYLRELQDVADRFLLVEDHTLRALTADEAREFFTRKAGDTGNGIETLFV